MVKVLRSKLFFFNVLQAFNAKWPYTNELNNFYRICFFHQTFLRKFIWKCFFAAIYWSLKEGSTHWNPSIHLPIEGHRDLLQPKRRIFLIYFIYWKHHTHNSIFLNPNFSACPPSFSSHTESFLFVLPNSKRYQNIMHASGPVAGLVLTYKKWKFSTALQGRKDPLLVCTNLFFIYQMF